MTSAPDYRKFAEQCLDMAERAPPEQRQTLLKMAEAWLELAHATLSTRQITEPALCRIWTVRGRTPANFCRTFELRNACPHSPQKRTFASCTAMSAKCQ